MAVEENVKENTPKAEGEAQGVKYISLTEEELEQSVSYTHLPDRSSWSRRNIADAMR